MIIQKLINVKKRIQIVDSWIERYGHPCNLVRVTGETFDYAGDILTTGTETIVSTKMFLQLPESLTNWEGDDSDIDRDEDDVIITTEEGLPLYAFVKSIDKVRKGDRIIFSLPVNIGSDYSQEFDVIQVEPETYIYRKARLAPVRS